jgi:hypothetical protein
MIQMYTLEVIFGPIAVHLVGGSPKTGPRLRERHWGSPVSSITGSDHPTAYGETICRFFGHGIEKVFTT